MAVNVFSNKDKFHDITRNIYGATRGSGRTKDAPKNFNWAGVPRLPQCSKYWGGSRAIWGGGVPAYVLKHFRNFGNFIKKFLLRIDIGLPSILRLA